MSCEKDGPNGSALTESEKMSEASKVAAVRDAATATGDGRKTLRGSGRHDKVSGSVGGAHAHDGG
jgi:hypothetical protein